MSNHPSWWDDHAVRMIKEFPELSCQRRAHLQLLIIEAMKYVALREERKDMLDTIRKMDEAMNMQECRELQTFHMPRATAYKIWSDARALAKEFLP